MKSAKHGPCHPCLAELQLRRAEGVQLRDNQRDRGKSQRAPWGVVPGEDITVSRNGRPSVVVRRDSTGWKGRASMTVKRMDNVGIVVESLDTAIAFFAELGLELEGRAM